MVDKERLVERALASLFAGAVAFMAALDAGLPVWRHLPIGDATDFGICTAFAVWFGLKSLRSLSTPLMKDEDDD